MPGASDATRVLAFATAAVDCEGEARPSLRHRRLGEGFAAPDAVHGRVVGVDGVVTVRFEVGDASRLDCIELVVPATAGSFCIHWLGIDGVQVSDLHRRVLLVRDQRQDASPGQLRFESRTRRPSVEIDVRGLAAGTSGVVDVVIARDHDRVPAAAAALDARMQSLEDVVQAQAREVSGMLLSGTARERERVRRLAALDARLEALDAAAAKRADTIESRLGQFEGQAQVAEAARLREADVVLERIAGLLAELHALREGQAQADARLDGMEQQLRNANASIDNLFWRRWGRWLRGVGR